MKTKSCVIWIRWSSQDQSRGTTLQRQKADSAAFCRREGLTILETVIAAGRTAKFGVLEEFKQLLKRLPKGVGIVTENLDRISRGDPLDALLMVRDDIISKGNWVATFSDGVYYTEQSRQVMGNRLTAYLKQELAYEENQKRRDRINKAFTAKIKMTKEGRRVTWGGHCPNYLKWNPETNQYDIIEEIRSVVEYIFNEYVNGKGMRQISTRLNQSNTPTFRGKIKKNTRDKSVWSQGTVREILKNPAFIGTFTIRGESYEDVFPPAIDKKLFYRVQQMLKLNQSKRGNYAAKTVQNIFRGICRCSKCKSSAKLLNRKVFGCRGAREGLCDVRHTLNWKHVEPYLLTMVIACAREKLLEPSDKQEELAAIQGELESIDTRINAQLDLLESGIAVEQIKPRLQKLEEQKEAAKKRLHDAKGAFETAGDMPDTIQQLERLWKQAQHDQETRQRLSVLVRKFIQRMDFDLEKELVTFIETDGNQVTVRLNFEEILSSK